MRERDQAQDLAEENARLRRLLQEARDHIGGMPTILPSGEDRFFPTLRLVEKIEAELSQ